MLRKSMNLLKEHVNTLKRARCRLYPTETITNADYADDLDLLANTSPQAEPRREQSFAGIDLYVNANKTESMCFKRKEAVNTWNDTSSK